jgi:hypothetical protein
MEESELLRKPSFALKLTSSIHASNTPARESSSKPTAGQPTSERFVRSICVIRFNSISIITSCFQKKQTNKEKKEKRTTYCQITEVNIYYNYKSPALSCSGATSSCEEDVFPVRAEKEQKTLKRKLLCIFVC